MLTTVTTIETIAIANAIVALAFALPAAATRCSVANVQYQKPRLTPTRPEFKNPTRRPTAPPNRAVTTIAAMRLRFMPLHEHPPHIDHPQLFLARTEMLAEQPGAQRSRLV